MVKYCDAVFPKYAKTKILYKYIGYPLEKSHSTDVRREMQSLKFLKIPPVILII